MQAQHVLNCAISAWYPNFESVTFRSKLVDLPQEFVRFLTEDGVFLGDSNQAFPRRAKQDPYATEDDYRDWDEEEASVSSVENELGWDQQFPELATTITAAIRELGGKVVPKFKWSCPKDAVFVSLQNNMVCTNVDEVLLLLKSSDRVAHDICNAFDDCPGGPPQQQAFQLALRKWYPLKQGREFRCFVREHQVVGISQRDVTEFFPWIMGQRNQVRTNLLEFHSRHIAQRFPDSDYTYDVYISTNGTIKLIDFNPFGGTTSPLLFSWNELLGDLPALRREQDSGAVVSTSGNPEHEPATASASQAIPSVDEDASCSRGQHSAAGSEATAHVEFRVLYEKPELVPASALYGIPYDMVDQSEGSAIDVMLRKMQEHDLLADPVTVSS